MLNSCRNLLVLILASTLCACSNQGAAPSSTPSPKASPTAQATPATSAHSDPQHGAAGEVKVNGKSYPLKSAVALWSTPNKLEIHLSDGVFSAQKAATLPTLHPDSIGKAVREAGTLDAKFYIVFKEDQPSREAKDVTFLMLSAMDGAASVSALPSPPLDTKNPASSFVSIEHLDAQGPGRAKLEIKSLVLGGDCLAAFSVDCPLLKL